MHYSAANNAFYPDSMQADYERGAGWPTDARPVPASVFEEFALNSPPQGKQRVPGDDGLPMWADVPPPTDEELAESVRRERDSLLSASDWTQLPDVPQATREAWAQYRQALRDVPQQAGFPSAIEWPIAPA